MMLRICHFLHRNYYLPKSIVALTDINMSEVIRTSTIASNNPISMNIYRSKDR